MKNERQIEEVFLKATRIAEEYKSLVEEVKLLIDNPMAKEIDKFDKTFMRKLQNYPGDLSAVRIKKVMGKLLGVNINNQGEIKD